MSANPRFFEELVQRLRSVLPPGLSEVKGDVERNLKTVLQSAFAKLDLVTREEFEVQTEVLARTRETLQQLQQQVAELEKILKVAAPDSKPD